MAIPKVIETTDEPLDLKGLRILIDENKYKVDLVLQYSLEDVPIKGARKTSKIKIKTEGSFQIFAKYHHPQIVRQIYTQRKEPRRFKNLERALSWGKAVGFRSASLAIDLDDYIGLDEVIR